MYINFVLYMDVNCYAAVFHCWNFFGYTIYVWPLAAIRIPIFHETFKEICTRT